MIIPAPAQVPHLLTKASLEGGRNHSQVKFKFQDPPKFSTDRLMGGLSAHGTAPFRQMNILHLPL